MGQYVTFSKLDNIEFSKLPSTIELTNAQRKAWHMEMRSRMFKHAHSFTKTMVVVDLTNGELEALTSSYRASQTDVTVVLQLACKKALACHRKLVVKAPSSVSAENGEARDKFMAGLGFSWNSKGARYERNL